MPVIHVIDDKKYGRLLAKHRPGVIRSNDEHDRLAGLLMNLALSGEKSAEEDRLIKLLERLVDDYDDWRMERRLAVFTPLELLEHLREEGGIRRVDLVDCFGAQSVGSAVLAGKRQINSEHARQLARRFGQPLSLFIR